MNTLEGVKHEVLLDEASRDRQMQAPHANPNAKQFFGLFRMHLVDTTRVYLAEALLVPYLQPYLAAPNSFQIPLQSMFNCPFILSFLLYYYCHFHTTATNLHFVYTAIVSTA